MTFFEGLATWKLYVSIGFTSALAVIFYLSYVDEFLSQRFFVLFVILAGCGIKLMAQAPVDDYGYVFIYCAPLLSMVFLTPRDTKLIISVNTFVFVLMLIHTVQTEDAGIIALNNPLFFTHFALFVVLNFALPLCFRDLTSINRMASNALVNENLKLRGDIENLQRLLAQSRQDNDIVNLDNSQPKEVNKLLKVLLGQAWESNLKSALAQKRHALDHYEAATVTSGTRSHPIESDLAYSPALTSRPIPDKTIQKRTPQNDFEPVSASEATTALLNRDALIQTLSAVGEVYIVTLRLERPTAMNEVSAQSVDLSAINQLIQRLRDSFPTSPLARLSRHDFVIVFNDKNLAEVQSHCRQLVHQTISRSMSTKSHCHVCISLASGSMDMLHHIIDKSLDLVHQSKNHLAYSFIMNESQYTGELQQRCEQLALLIEQKRLKTFYRPFRDSTGNIKGVEANTLLDLPERDDSLNKELIRIAKRNGQIASISINGLEQVCRTIIGMAKGKRLPEDFLVTVNLSVAELMSESFIHQFIETLNKFPVRPENMAIAISERTFLEHWEEVRLSVQTLRSLGFRLAIRDVSLPNEIMPPLTDAPVDCILLDSDFVNASLQKPFKGSPLHSIGALCSELGIRLVARDVECSGDEADSLQRFGDLYWQCRQLEPGLSSAKTIELIQSSVSV
ncbi:diguanylate cyclase/phosphodiesterase (GGDEF & EAL domains) with PAS/PAC sensor(s) [Reinekea sp. MED297]|uniref:Diguanylate cyclase/phosphodiesterase (GGDEF & EAL domains) with PAS/PAC sensor(S) n=2 Tax=Reinekea TaxID=230494 RepID=A4BJM1_9GAMM|nr:diguanylate cyclase/phosphodiesterase (GGDEF & EAL domains) with PAS/PAC sensor(s) [Reinekea sp. MED297] [Reinekea blandensis MED297]